VLTVHSEIKLHLWFDWKQLKKFASSDIFLWENCKRNTRLMSGIYLAIENKNSLSKFYLKKYPLLQVNSFTNFVRTLQDTYNAVGVIALVCGTT
jgi:hypothetical protein